MIKLVKGLFEGEGKLTQSFGENPQAYAKFGLSGHNGVDYGIPTGRKLYSCIDGKVIEAQLDKTGYGNYVKIENDGCGVLYGHLKSFSVKVGDTVKVGQVLGLSNNTGNSTGPHLHFGVFPKPRDRGNGYAGYINPFDKSLVTWVDSLDNPVCDCDALQKELDEMRESRDRWKSKYEEADEEHTKDLQAKIKHNSGSQDAYAKDIADYRQKLASKEQECQQYKDSLTEANKENERLNALLKNCQTKEVSMDYPKWKIIAWRYVRVFLASFLVSFASGLVGVTDFHALNALVVASLTAAIPAVAKLLREEISGGDVTSLVNKLPL